MFTHMKNVYGMYVKQLRSVIFSKMTVKKDNLAVWSLYHLFLGLRLYLHLYYGSSHIVALEFAFNLQSQAGLKS